MIPKTRNVKLELKSDKFKILANFFRNDFTGRIHETIYAKFGFLIIKFAFKLSSGFPNLNTFPSKEVISK